MYVWSLLDECYVLGRETGSTDLSEKTAGELAPWQTAGTSTRTSPNSTRTAYRPPWQPRSTVTATSTPQRIG